MRYDVFLTFDKPITHKGLRFHPIRMKDYYVFMTLASCLFLEKNSIKDPILAAKAISMTYIEYLVAISDEDNKLLYFLDGLFRLVLNQTEDSKFSLTFKKRPNGKLGFNINGIDFEGYEFEEFRSIIALQNGLDLPDEKIQKNVREKLDEAKRLKEKFSSNEKITGLEGQVLALSLFTGWSLEYIENLPIRKFFMLVRRANHMIMSDIYLQASMSGFVKFKNKDALRGWLANIEEDDKYGDVKVDPESVQKKLNFEGVK